MMGPRSPSGGAATPGGLAAAPPAIRRVPAMRRIEALTSAIARRLEALDARGWRRLVFSTALAAFALRLLVIWLDRGRGGADLRQYVYFGDLALHGHNAYLIPPGQIYTNVAANNQPLELGLFAGLLGIDDSGTSIRVGFAVIDAAIIPIIGLLWTTRPRAWRAAIAVFLAFNPFTLMAWTAYSEDKPALLALIALTLLYLERERWGATWAATTVLAAFKWVSVFFALPLLIETAKRVPKRTLLIILGLCALAFAISEIPSFPEDLKAYGRRDARIDLNPPIHASITMLLSKIGIYSPAEVRPFIVVGLLAVYLLWWRGRLSLAETIVLSMLVAQVALPNQAVNRILQIAIPLLFVIRLTAARWIVIWVVSAISGIVLYINTRGSPGLTKVFGVEGNVKHTVIMNVLLVLLLVYFFLDKRAKRRQRHTAVAATISATTSRRSWLAS